MELFNTISKQIGWMVYSYIPSLVISSSLFQITDRLFVLSFTFAYIFLCSSILYTHLKGKSVFTKKTKTINGYTYSSDDSDVINDDALLAYELGLLDMDNW